MKTCSKCLLTKPLTEFYREKTCRLGVRSVCKTCDQSRNCGYARMPHRRYRRAAHTAQSRGLVWALTFEVFQDLIVQPCTYCGGALPVAGSGIDRVDSSLGYTVENVTPCCGECNRVKSDVLTYEEMLQVGEVLKKIYAARQKAVAAALPPE